jgi:hypothetical protein
VTLDVERAVWTDADFDVMGWHDCTVHAVAMTEDGDGSEFVPAEFALDIDYIVQWVKPVEVYYRFWIVPATLVFHDVWGVKGELDAQRALLELDGIERAATLSPDGSAFTTWTLNGHDFGLELVARGYTQWLRCAPILTDRQRLPSAARGGHSFARVRGW